MGLTFFQAWQFMNSESPVFIVGAARSGTSILYRILQKHSSFRLPEYDSPSGASLVESHIFQKPYNLANKTLISYLLEDEDIYRQFVGATQGIRQYQSLIFTKIISGKLYRKQRLSFLRSVFWKLSLSNVLVAYFFYYAKQARKCQRILEKTPLSIFHLPEIKSTFPKAKLLFIYRHPIDVFGSYKKRLKKSLELNVKKSELLWLEISPEKFCSLYQGSVGLALKESAANSEHFLLIAYEDLVSRTQETVSNICNFLGEPYEENCMVKDETNLAKFEVDPHLFGEVQKVTKNWRDFVSETEAKYIEDKLQGIMDKLGYASYSSLHQQDVMITEK